LGVRGLNKNVRTTFCKGGHDELTAQKWLDSIEKRKRRSNVCDRQTDGQTDRVNDKKIIDSYSWAQRSIVCSLSEKYEKSRIIVLLCCQSEGNIFIYWSTTSAVRYKNVNRLTLYRGQNNKSVAYRLLAAIAKIVI